MNKGAFPFVVLLALASPALARESVNDYFDMSLQELAEVEVTTASKRSEKISEIAAAVHVITEEDIRRSSARSIPELLRGVPGLQVARAGSHDWAISARGFNAQFANKLLVLIDGRTVYTPLFSGVFWDVQDTLIEDIERIEVIRGPGGTIWGANAVNGIINIITKHSSETQGGLARATLGTHRKDTALRYGKAIDEDSYFRSYASYKRINEFDLASGQGAGDDWSQWRGGFRLDSQLETKGDVKVQGEIYAGAEDSWLSIPSLANANLTANVRDRFDVSGGHLLSTWEYTDGKNEYSLLGYYDLAKRNTFPFENATHTVDIDFNHSFEVNDTHQLMWGAGYRLIHTNINSTAVINFDPEVRTDNLWSAFISDRIGLFDDSLFLTIGSKFEHNDYTGFEWQPSARMVWLPAEDHTFWASVARAVRTPNRATHDLEIAFAATPLPTGGSALIAQHGDNRTDSENLIAYEAGYRTQPTKKTSFDIALFFNDYQTLVADSRTSPIIQTNNFYGPHLVIPFVVNDSASGETMGLEMAANWQVTDQWLLGGTFSYIDMDLQGGSTFVSSEANTPQHQFGLSSRYSFNEDLEWDNFFHYADELGKVGSVIPAYWQWDSRLAWYPSDGVELSLVGRNLLDDQHPEFSGFIYQSQIEVPRSVFGKVTLKF